jgi:hypothetical protein
MSEPNGTPTTASSAPQPSATPNRKVIAGAASDLVMTGVSALAIHYLGHDLDPATASAISVLVSAVVGFAVAYAVPNAKGTS